MQSHNLQHAPARYVLHFFQIFKEQTPTNDITYMSIKKSAMKTRPAGHHHDLLLACTALCYLQWWSWSGSNRRPTACKAAALPAELQPHTVSSNQSMVGLVGFEPTTPALSRRCSNQLSYRPSHLLRGSSLEQPISCGYLAECSLFLLKGGDPAAPSDTATLLRLHPSHESHRGKRPPEG